MGFYESFILLVGALGAELHKDSVKDELEDGYHCLWFGSLLVIFVSFCSIISWTGRCPLVNNRYMSLAITFLLFLAIVLDIAAASIFTDTFGESCGQGYTKDDCKAQLFFLYISPFPIRATLFYFKLRDLGYAR